MQNLDTNGDASALLKCLLLCGPSVMPCNPYLQNTFHILSIFSVLGRKLEVAEVPLVSTTRFLPPVLSGFQFTLYGLNPFSAGLGESLCRCIVEYPP